MHWDAVAVAVRHGQPKEEIEKEMNLLVKLGLFSTEELIFVEDACDDVGSAGSVLNALLITSERLCAKDGQSVLNENILHDCSVLILLVGEASSHKPHGAAFLPLSSPNKWDLAPDTVLVRQLKVLETLKASEHKGVWICGTDSCFTLGGLKEMPKICGTSITGFSFYADAQENHGTYMLNEEGLLKSIEYPSPFSPSAPLVVPLLYFPPPVAASFLALHSSDPLIGSTYYGEDTGTLGLKLSLFFDILLATCLSKLEFLEDGRGAPKIDNHPVLRKHARQVIWKKLHQFPTNIVIIPGGEFCYLATDEAARQVNQEKWSLEKIRSKWESSLFSSLSNNVVNHPSPVPQLQTLVSLYQIFNGSISTLTLQKLESVALSYPHAASRCFFIASEFLSLLAKGKGGLRMGPAANPSFSKYFSLLRDKSTVKEGISGVFSELREKWLTDAYRLTRGARHSEAAGQILYGAKVMEMKPKVPPFRWIHGSKGVRVKAAARVDIFGGWLDTPPITFETSPSAVINMAITLDNQLPLCCTVRPSASPGLTYSAEDRTIALLTTEAIRCAACHPHSHGALVCACLVVLGVLDDKEEPLDSILSKIYGSPGIEVTCSSTLPHGSGLGTSSILAAAILTALRGDHFDKENLVHLVLNMEQILTTGGGWQDQVGGIYGGVKIGRYEDGRIEAEKISITEAFEKEINERLVLIYTGKTRLAKNLLQEVVRNWYLGGEVVYLLKEMQDNLENCKNALQKGTFPSEMVELYYKTKKGLAPGCEPPQVRQIIENLKRAGISRCAWIAGAGGGGFLYTWLKEGRSFHEISNFVEGSAMTAQQTAVCDDPLMLSVID